MKRKRFTQVMAMAMAACLVTQAIHFTYADDQQETAVEAVEDSVSEEDTDKLEDGEETEGVDAEEAEAEAEPEDEEGTADSEGTTENQEEADGEAEEETSVSATESTDKLTVSAASVSEENELEGSWEDTFTTDPDFNVTRDNDSRLNGYLLYRIFGVNVAGIQKSSYGSSYSYYGEYADGLLSGDAYKVYEILREEVAQAAAGELDSTVLPVDLSGFDFSWTLDELGADSSTTSEELKELALDALSTKIDADMLDVCLVDDCIYDLYWYDETRDMDISFTCTCNGNTVTVDSLAVTLYVTEEYQDGSDTAIDTSILDTAKTAKANADAIVEKYADCSDADKLEGYLDEFSSIGGYNSDSVDLSEAMELVYMFDGDKSTKVVCSGFTGSFQYLCDISDFDDVQCYYMIGTVTKPSGSSGSHGWNVVCMDGVYYLCDLTLSYACSWREIMPFMVSAADADACSASGYTFTFNYTYTIGSKEYEYTGTYAYTYYSIMTYWYSNEVLSLGTESETAVTGITVSPKTLSLTEGEEGKVTAAVSPSDAANTDVSYTSSDTSVATVSEDGTVTAVSGGTCVITATSGDGGYTAQCTVTVAHSLECVDAVAATCQAEGNIKYWACTGCGKVFTDENAEDEITLADTVLAADKANHTGELVVRNAKAATCTSEGYTGDTCCSDCGEVVEAGEVIDRKAHTLTHTAAVAATCTAEGNIEYWTCSECGKVFADEACTEEITLEDTILAVDAANHSGERVVKNAVEATCSSEGYTGDTYCTDCGKVVEYGEAIEKLSHDLTHYEAVEATCITTGQVEHWTCAECGTIFLDEGCTTETTLDAAILAIDPANHTGETEIKNAVEPTYTSEGYTGDVYCKACGQLLESGETIDKLTHTMVHHEAVAATCTSEGNIEYWTCEDCDAVFSDQYGETEITLEDTVIAVDTANHTGELIVKDAKDATCTSEGYTGDTYCSDCGDLVKTGETIAKTAHTLTHTEAAAATCTAEGNIAYWTCSECGKVFSDEDAANEITLEDTVLAVDSTNHSGTLVVKDAKEATCTSEGYTGNTYCTDCGEVVEYGEAIAMKAHTLTHTAAVAATCTAEGNIEYWTCSECGKIFADEACTEEISAEDTILAKDTTNHTGDLEVKNTIEATCTTEGYSGDTYCTDCGEVVEAGEAIAKLAHELVHHEAVTPTCTEEGNIEYWTCSECGKVFTDEDGANEITLEDTILAADPENHTGTLETRHAATATCTSEGYTGDTYCTDCGGLVSAGEAIPMKDHTLAHTDAVAATCTTKGNIEYWTCTECGKIFADENAVNEITLDDTVLAVDSTNHTGELVVKDEKEATCTAEGYTGDTYCTDCGEIVEAGESIAKLDHELTHYEAIEATCITTGQVEHWTCTECGTIFLDEDCTTETTLDATILAIDPANHTGETEIRNAVEPTYTSEGYSGDVYCKACGELLESGRTIDKLTHTMVHHEAVAATCTSEGNIEYWTCEDCDLVFADQYGETEITLEDTVLAVDKTNHTGELVVKDAKDATCTSEGYTGDTYCTDCGELVKAGETIAKTAHNLTHTEAVAATCTAEGNIEYWTCTDCGKVFADEDCTEEITMGDTVLAIDSTNHTGDLVVKGAAEATCTTEGYTGDTYCTDCGQIVEAGEAIAKTAHTLAHTDAVAATCTTEGNIEYWACTECGKIFADEACTEEITAEDTVLAVDSTNHTGDLVVKGAAEATCTSEGYTGDTYCTDCGQIVKSGETIAVKAHNLTHTEAVAATCTAEGNIEYWTCTECGKIFTDEDAETEITLDDTILAKDPDNHTGYLETRHAADATCTEDGYTGDVYCTDCDRLVRSGETIEKLGHELTHYAAIEATCITTGQVEHWTCAECGNIYLDEDCTIEATLDATILAIDPANHTGETEVKNVVDPTYTSEGYTGDVYCKACGELLESGETIEKLEYKMVHHEAVEATCTSEGNIEFWTCEDCNKVFADLYGETEITLEDTILAVDATNHTGDLIVKGAVEATCTSEGYTGDTYCTDCGELVKAGETIAVKAHTLIHTDGIAATCTTEGNIEYWTCAECGKIFADADCTEKISLDDTVLAADATNHTGELVVKNAKEATCTTEGYTGDTYCSDCGELVKAGEAIAKKAHTLTHTEAVAATCTAEGNVEYWICSECGKVFADEDAENEITMEDTVLAVDPENHTGSLEVRDASAATCAAEGYTGDTYCTECGKLVEAGEVIAKTAHNLLHTDALVATCMTEGNIEYWTCTECGKVFADADCTEEITLKDTILAVDSTNHAGSLEVRDAADADCETDGYTGDTYCTACGELVESGDVIPAAGHILVHYEAVEATATEDGNTEYWICSACGKTFSDANGEAEVSIEETVIPATGETTTTPDEADTPNTGDHSSIGQALVTIVVAVVATVVSAVKSIFCRR